MRKIVGSLLGLGLALGAGKAGAGPAAGPAVTKDAKGRVISRTTTNPDMSGHRTVFQYGPESDQPVVVLDHDFDQAGRTTKRVEQKFDGQGRLLEKLDVSKGTAGKDMGIRTQYHYDDAGRRTEEIIPIR
jgi:hypothetical protein